MTIMTATPERARHTSVLGSFDVLDVSEAIRNAVSPHCTRLNPRDRQALAHLTYELGLRGITRMLLSRLANGTAALPLPDGLATHLMGVHGDHDLLPVIDEDVQDAWLAAHDAAALRRVADGKAWDEDMWLVHSLTSRMTCCDSDITDAERAAMQDVAWDGTLGRCQVAVLRQLADRLIAEAPKVTLSPCQHTDERPELADVPHSITVERITPELRYGTELPDDATLVVVERHAGRLAKVCNITDAHVADYTEWGYDVTIEDLARGIAGTYGATYVETALAVTR
ncbi:hypothetical protein ACQP2T_13340 [Nonomuraea sp. CA-143628]|uniref:hypothetical protein n=1 Tax=Nonomuraea sp. CA-143628 TaxID=3239997 RepID=UPI003D939EB8